MFPTLRVPDVASGGPSRCVRPCTRIDGVCVCVCLVKDVKVRTLLHGLSCVHRGQGCCHRGAQLLGGFLGDVACRQHESPFEQLTLQERLEGEHGQLLFASMAIGQAIRRRNGVAPCAGAEALGEDILAELVLNREVVRVSASCVRTKNLSFLCSVVRLHPGSK